MVDLLQLYDVRLLQNLHGEVLSSFSVPTQTHPAERAWQTENYENEKNNLPVPSVVDNS